MAIIGFVHECDHPASCFIPCMMRNIMPKSCMWRKRERERKRGWMRRFDSIVARVRCGCNVYAINCMGTNCELGLRRW